MLQSDLDLMQAARDALSELGVAHEVRVLSAHRTPDALFDYVRDARGAWSRGVHRRRQAVLHICRA